MDAFGNIPVLKRKHSYVKITTKKLIRLLSALVKEEKHHAMLLAQETQYSSWSKSTLVCKPSNGILLQSFILISKHITEKCPETNFELRTTTFEKASQLLRKSNLPLYCSYENTLPPFNLISESIEKKSRKLVWQTDWRKQKTLWIVLVVLYARRITINAISFLQLVQCRDHSNHFLHIRELNLRHFSNCLMKSCSEYYILHNISDNKVLMKNSIRC